VCNVTEPLVKVLRLVDGEKPTMGYLYEAMNMAKESIGPNMMTREMRGSRDNSSYGK